MLDCQFALNGKSMSEFKIGASAWAAYSGSGSQQNKRRFMSATQTGPIPPGQYHVVDAQAVGLNGGAHGAWFALYASDGKVDDDTMRALIAQGGYRLQPAGEPGAGAGCVTIHDKAQFQFISMMLRNASIATVAGTSMQAFGKLTVV